MFPLGKVSSLNDILTPLPGRSARQTYFVRISAFNPNIRGFLSRYFQLAQQNGVLIDGKIPNPNETNLSFYNDKMGQHFEFSLPFIEQGLAKWMPRVQPAQQKELARAVYEELLKQQQQGKTESILKNAFIKYFCWLYCKFERISAKIGTDDLPKILYVGQISRPELQMLNILNRAGCDVLLLQKGGDAEYLKIDAASAVSQAYNEPGSAPIPDDFSLKQLIREAMPAPRPAPVNPAPVNRAPVNTAAVNRVSAQPSQPPRPSIPPQQPRDIRVQPQKIMCANAWDKVSGKPLEDALVPSGVRSNDPNMICTIFARINGVEDKLTYQSELRTFHQQLTAGKRQCVVIEGGISTPTPEEAQTLRRRPYKTIEEVIVDLRLNISAGANATLQNLMQAAFTDTMLELTRRPDMNVSRLSNMALHLLCWLKRYQGQLFSRWQSPEVACLIYMGGCRSDKESCFLKMMSRLPVDVILLRPNLDEACTLSADNLMEANYSLSMAVERFPTGDARVGTAAYHAERELDTLMYQDTGMYRNHQFSRAESIALRTTFEEFLQLWDLELKYRPNYTTVNGSVSIPVIYTRVCGVKNASLEPYWVQIKKLMTDNTKVITQLPFLTGREPNPIASSATDFLQRGKLNREKIRNHRAYPFAILREETQTYILDKIQVMLDEKLIKGIGVNGMEYLVISTILNINKDLQRMIQQFDFTKKNPKLLIINTRESMASQEDAILFTFLHLIGFDIAIFVPTGYQSIERWLGRDNMDEHQIGEYMYDLAIPDFHSISTRTRPSWNNIFRR